MTVQEAIAAYDEKRRTSVYMPQWIHGLAQGAKFDITDEMLDAGAKAMFPGAELIGAVTEPERAIVRRVLVAVRDTMIGDNRV